MKMPSPRFMGVIVLVSLAANLFLAGLLAGDWLRGRFNPPPYAASMNFSAMRHALGPEAGAVIEPVMRQHREMMHRQVDAVRAARREVGAALAAEPFDRTRLEESLSRMRGRGMEAQAAFHAVFVDVVAGLTLDQRQELARESQRRRRPDF
jgi:uncharacterized membrane protein